MSTNKKFPTRCVHEGEIKDTMYQGIVSPLFMSTTYPWFGGDAEKKPYPRYFNTPNQEFLSKKIASLENGEKALSSNVPFSSVLILYLSLVFWTLTYDTVYATQDEKEDKELKLYSSTLFFGASRMIILNLMIFFKYFLLAFFGSGLNFSFLYYVLLTTIFLINIIDLNFMWKNIPEKAGSYFNRNNYYGISILFSIIIGSHLNV
jgi:hypothetical protein